MNHSDSLIIPITLGWREWVALPELGISRMKAKIDTGARSSCLHAFVIETFEHHGLRRVRFGFRTRRGKKSTEQYGEADVIDERLVRDSGGHEEKRLFVATTLEIGKHQWPIELNISSRDGMCFRLLIGRTALPKGTLVDPRQSYLASSKQKPK